MALSKKLSSLMVAIVAATLGAEQMLMVKTADAQLLSTSGLVETNPNQVENGTIATRATQAGIDQYGPKTDEAGNVIETAPVAAKVKPSFAIATVELPEMKRGGRTAEMYPFDALEKGQSFFVPATDKKPDPAKSLASTVTAANERFSTESPTGETRVNRKGNTVPVRVQDREFALRAIPDGVQWGEQFAGVAGAGIWRTL